MSALYVARIIFTSVDLKEGIVLIATFALNSFPVQASNTRVNSYAVSATVPTEMLLASPTVPSGFSIFAHSDKLSYYNSTKHSSSCYCVTTNEHKEVFLLQAPPKNLFLYLNMHSVAQ